jgi:mRNA-degrading endonuclease HigB of HigAB toxin-antitoxin module
LKSQAAEQEHKLAEKQAKAKSALMMITETMRNANTHKVEMEALKDQTERENLLLMERCVIFNLHCKELFNFYLHEYLVHTSLKVFVTALINL